MSSDLSKARRYDLDWLRVLLFALLVIHHAAVGFVPFGADIYGFANDRLSGEGLSLAVYFTHGWRLPALFLISGIGTYFATARIRGPGFVSQRLARLLIPALFGAFILNLVAGYAISRATASDVRLGEFVLGWWLNPELSQIMHLWFLVNLAIYTFLTWPLYFLRSRLETIRLAPCWLSMSLVVGVTLIAVLGKPYASAVAGDGYQFPWYWGIFAAGYVIGAQHERILDWAAERWWLFVIGGVIGFAIEVSILAQALDDDPAFGAALASGGWAAEGLAPAYRVNTLVFCFAEGVNAFSWSFAVLGLSARYLNWTNPVLAQLSRATFPIYVLHFPFTIVGLALLALVPWPWPLELLMLVIFTFAGTTAVYLAAEKAGFPMILIGGRARTPKPAARDH